MGGLFKKGQSEAPQATETATQTGAAEEPSPAASAAPAVRAEKAPDLPYGGWSLTGHSSGLRTLVFSTDGHTLAAATQDSRVHLWDLSHKQHSGEFSGMDVVAFSPFGRFLASRSEGISIFEVATGKELWTIPGEQMVEGHRGWWKILSACISPDGETLALSLDQAAGPTSKGHEKQVIVLYEVKRARQRRLDDWPGAMLLGFSPDASQLALRLADDDSQVVVVDARVLRPAPKPDDPPPEPPWRLGYIESIRSGALSTEGLAAGGESLSLRSLEGDELASIKAGEPLDSLLFSPDGQLLMAADASGWTLRRGETLEEVRRISLEELPLKRSGEHTRLVSSFSADGRWLAVGEAPASLGAKPLPVQPLCLWEVAQLLA